MRIKKIKIKEYKQFENLELDFKDGLNLIVGGGVKEDEKYNGCKKDYR